MPSKKKGYLPPAVITKLPEVAPPPKRTRGRPKVIFNMGAIHAAAETGQSATEISRSLGIPLATFMRKLRDPENSELRQIVAHGRACGSRYTLEALRESVRAGKVGAIRMMMERLESDG